MDGKSGIVRMDSLNYLKPAEKNIYSINGISARNSSEFKPRAFNSSDLLFTNNANLTNVKEEKSAKKAVEQAKTGDLIAKTAKAVSKKMNSVGLCYRGVKKSLRKFGINLWGGSAYMGASQLAKNPKFEEIKVPKNELKKLPAGSVVVWGKNKQNPDGHISISLGDGQEASDHVQKQVNLNGKYRVFSPKVEEK